ncbi:unnamed protein product [Rhizoctonia solani]|uniref:Uncharacterized protein n=1 Tax=Rhizoctonia solani TaxID=456999 RepID=A0A8H3BPG5_9AGAM|nr:unnamed protein product [Rhizoctonia solani]
MPHAASTAIELHLAPVSSLISKSKDHPMLPVKVDLSLIGELNEASNLLNDIIDRYTQACGDIVRCFGSGSIARAVLKWAKEELFKYNSHVQKYRQAKVSMIGSKPMPKIGSHQYPHL